MNQNVIFTPIKASELDSAFAMYKTALFNLIELTFGWDEAFQLRRFHSEYQPEWFYWIDIGMERVGYICYWVKPTEMHVSLLIIDPEKQNRGHGEAAMLHLHEMARAKKSKVTLSSFRKNQAAIRFYERLNYKIVGGDENFVDMALS